ncbi:MAG TPA: hypothetical protein VGS17_00610 [Candidatus Limnocylindria bacterium]|nr:hypothetical protein [Candidatus Limnocylindria bacterium]
MLSTIPSLQVTAKAAGLTAALVLGLTFGLGASPASAHIAGHPVAATAQENEEATCDDAAAEAAVAAAEQQLKAAFRTNRHAIETLRDNAGDENKAARDLLRKAAADLERIFAKAESALDVDDEDEDAAACTTPDPAALDAIVTTATADMEAVVTEVTAAVAALPADAAKADDEDD